LDCTACGHTAPLFKDYRVAKGRYDNDDKYNVLCPDCGDIVLVDDWQSECKEIPPGHMTSERNPVFDHGYEKWTDMFNDR